MQKKIVLIVILVILAAGAIFVLTRNDDKNDLNSQTAPIQTQAGQNKIAKTQDILIGQNKLTVEIADTIESRAKGLGGRDSLGQEQGMLFLFDQQGAYSFWMKDMKISLDLIWISGDKIVDLTENVPAPKNLSDNLPTYQPKEKVDKVLEVNAGWVARHDVKIGDRVEL